MHDRVLPHSLEAERAVLGAALVSASAWPVVASTISGHDFFRDAHSRLFEAMSVLALRDTPIDVITVVEELKKTGDLDDVGGLSYITGLTDGVPRSANAQHYAEIVKEKKRLRVVAEIGAWMSSAAYSADRPAADVAEEATRRLLDGIASSGAGVVSADAVIAEYAAALGSGTLGDPVMTGYIDVDKLTGGFRPSDLVIVAARPSVGKTSWMLGAADYMAQHNQRAAVFSLEMHSQAIGARLLSFHCNVPMSKLERGEATDHEYQQASTASLAKYGDPPMLVIEDESRTVTEIHAWCKRVQASGGLSCVLIDYLQLLSTDKRGDSRQDELETIARSLKRMAKDLNVVVIALAQLSRASDSRRDKRPRLNDLRGSGALEQDADMVVFLYREELHKKTPENDGVAECIVAKNRNGPVGVARMQFNGPLMRFRNLSRDE